MIITEHISSAIRSLTSNKLRAILSMLGIIIGVASIIVLMAYGNGTTSTMMSRFSSLGADLLTISPGGSNTSKVGGLGGGGGSTINLIDDDFVDYVSQIDGVSQVSPSVSSSKQLIYGSNNTNASIVGVKSQYQTIRNLTISQGRFISDSDSSGRNEVIVLGNTLASTLFGTTSPVGKDIRLGNGIYTVVGVLADNSNSNNKAYVPLQTAMRKIIGTYYYSSLDVKVKDKNQVTQMQTIITNELLSYLKISDPNNATFSVSSMNEILTTMQDMSNSMQMFLGGIAGISLLVGGIGVMNIMLVSVTERTKEIGIRKAIGATRGDILIQFMIESLFISVLAGIIGVLLSFGIVKILNSFTTAIISRDSIVLAFGSVVLIGVFFGIMPAQKASNLSPIEALRYE